MWRPVPGGSCASRRPAVRERSGGNQPTPSLRILRRRPALLPAGPLAGWRYRRIPCTARSGRIRILLSRTTRNWLRLPATGRDVPRSTWWSYNAFGLHQCGGGVNAGGVKRCCHFLERRLMDLGDTAFVDAQQAADFLHGQFLGIVEGYHFLISLGKRLDGNVQDLAKLFMCAHVVGPALSRGGELGGIVLVAIRRIAGRGHQTHSPELEYHLAPAIHTDAQFFGNLTLSWSAFQLVGKLARDGFHHLLPLAQIP